MFWKVCAAGKWPGSCERRTRHIGLIRTRPSDYFNTRKRTSCDRPYWFWFWVDSRIMYQWTPASYKLEVRQKPQRCSVRRHRVVPSGLQCSLAWFDQSQPCLSLYTVQRHVSISWACFKNGIFAYCKKPKWFISEAVLLERPLYICQSRRWHCGDRHFAQQLNVHWPCLPIASARLTPSKMLIVQPVVTRFCNLAF